ncbi:MAG TPA: acyltransferase family protein [Mucilaginibacter sp.]|nr:acyltransferase family protein [Mucilaginibacter sp.]
MPISLSNHSDQRLSWVDYSKGIGIVLAVYGHVIRGLKEAGAIDDGTFFRYSDTFVYSFHMPLFFILSGYFFYDSFIKDPAKFTINKFKTLLYPFVIWSLLQTLVEVLLNKFTNTKIPPEALITCIFIPRDQFWFVYALFFIFILNALFFRITKKFGLYISIATWFIYWGFHYNLGPFNQTFQYLIFFNIGIIFSRFNKQFFVLLKSNKLLLLNIFLFTLFEYLYFSITKNTRSFHFLFITVAVLGSLIIMQLSERAVLNKILIFFIFLGKESLAIYLVHILVASGTRVILLKILHIYSPVVNILAGTILGIVIPLIIYSFAVKRPYLSWLFKFPFNKKNDKNKIRDYQIT